MKLVRHNFESSKSAGMLNFENQKYFNLKNLSIDIKYDLLIYLNTLSFIYL